MFGCDVVDCVVNVCFVECCVVDVVDEVLCVVCGFEVDWLCVG